MCVWWAPCWRWGVGSWALPFTKDIMHNGTILAPLLVMEVEMGQICMLSDA